MTPRGFPFYTTADFLVMAALRMPDIHAAMARALDLAAQHEHPIHEGLDMRIARFGWKTDEFSPESIISYAMGGLAEDAKSIPDLLQNCAPPDEIARRRERSRERLADQARRNANEDARQPKETPRNPQKGHMLTELLISLALGTVVLWGTAALWIAGR